MYIYSITNCHHSNSILPVPFSLLSQHIAGPGIRQKRRMFFVSIYGVLPTEEYTILKVTQETTTLEIVQQVRDRGVKNRGNLASPSAK